MRVHLIAVAGLLACADPKPRQDWENIERIDLATWGAMCGQRHQPAHPELVGVQTRVWSNSSTRSGPLMVCALDSIERTGKIWQIRVSGSSVDRAQAEKLIGDLVLPYLPAEVQLAARSVAFTEPKRYQNHQIVGGFDLRGGWDQGLAGASVQLHVALGKPPKLPDPPPLPYP